MKPYVKAAPDSLIELYEGGVAKGRKQLEALLTHPRMDEGWKELKKHVEDDFDYQRIFVEITYLLQRARKEAGLRRSDERANFTKIEKHAKKLAALIANGPLDKLAFEFFPIDVMDANGISNWNTLNTAERHYASKHILPSWPGLPEILVLVERAAHDLGADAMTKTRLVERTTSGSAEHRRLFLIRGLTDFFRKGYKGAVLYGTVANFCSAALQEDISAAEVAKAIRGSH